MYHCDLQKLEVACLCVCRWLFMHVSCLHTIYIVSAHDIYRVFTRYRVCALLCFSGIRSCLFLCLKVAVWSIQIDPRCPRLAFLVAWRAAVAKKRREEGAHASFPESTWTKVSCATCATSTEDKRKNMKQPGLSVYDECQLAQCVAATKKGTRCKRTKLMRQNEIYFCSQHLGHIHVSV
eukprot:g44158.t1